MSFAQTRPAAHGKRNIRSHVENQESNKVLERTRELNHKATIKSWKRWSLPQVNPKKHVGRSCVDERWGSQALDWSSTQRLVALSSCQADLYAMNKGAPEAMVVRCLAEDMAVILCVVIKQIRNQLQNASANQEKVESENNVAAVVTESVNAKVLNEQLAHMGFIKGIATSTQAGTSL